MKYHYQFFGFHGGTPLLINRQNSSEELAPKNSYPWHPHEITNVNHWEFRTSPHLLPVGCQWHHRLATAQVPDLENRRLERWCSEKASWAALPAKIYHVRVYIYKYIYIYRQYYIIFMNILSCILSLPHFSSHFHLPLGAGGSHHSTQVGGGDQGAVWVNRTS